MLGAGREAPRGRLVSAPSSSSRHRRRLRPALRRRGRGSRYFCITDIFTGGIEVVDVVVPAVSPSLRVSTVACGDGGRGGAAARFADADTYGPILHEIRRPATRDDAPANASTQAHSVLGAHGRRSARQLAPRTARRPRPIGSRPRARAGRALARTQVASQVIRCSLGRTRRHFESYFHVSVALARGEEGGVAPVRKSSCSSSSSSSSSSDELDSSMGCCGGICIIGGTAYSIGAFGTNCAA